MSGADGDPVAVVVPGADYEADADMSALWRGTGSLFALAARRMPADRVIAVMLSRLARETRRLHGPDDAAKVFRGFADTMRAAEENDR